MCKSHDQRSIKSISFYAIVINYTGHLLLCAWECVNMCAANCKEKQHENINKYIECVFMCCVDCHYNFHIHIQQRQRRQQQQPQQIHKYLNNRLFYWIFSIYSEFIQCDVHCSFWHMHTHTHRHSTARPKVRAWGRLWITLNWG